MHENINEQLQNISTNSKVIYDFHQHFKKCVYEYCPSMLRSILVEDYLPPNTKPEYNFENVYSNITTTELISTTLHEFDISIEPIENELLFNTATRLQNTVKTKIKEYENKLMIDLLEGVILNNPENEIILTGQEPSINNAYQAFLQHMEIDSKKRHPDNYFILDQIIANISYINSGIHYDKKIWSILSSNEFRTYNYIIPKNHIYFIDFPEHIGVISYQCPFTIKYIDPSFLNISCFYVMGYKILVPNIFRVTFK